MKRKPPPNRGQPYVIWFRREPGAVRESNKVPPSIPYQRVVDFILSQWPKAEILTSEEEYVR